MDSYKDPSYNPGKDRVSFSATAKTIPHRKPVGAPMDSNQKINRSACSTDSTPGYIMVYCGDRYEYIGNIYELSK